MPVETVQNAIGIFPRVLPARVLEEKRLVVGGDADVERIFRDELAFVLQGDQRLIHIRLSVDLQLRQRERDKVARTGHS